MFNLNPRFPVQLFLEQHAGPLEPSSPVPVQEKTLFRFRVGLIVARAVASALEKRGRAGIGGRKN